MIIDDPAGEDRDQAVLPTTTEQVAVSGRVVADMMEKIENTEGIERQRAGRDGQAQTGATIPPTLHDRSPVGRRSGRDPPREILKRPRPRATGCCVLPSSPSSAELLVPHLPHAGPCRPRHCLPARAPRGGVTRWWPGSSPVTPAHFSAVVEGGRYPAGTLTAANHVAHLTLPEPGASRTRRRDRCFDHSGAPDPQSSSAPAPSRRRSTKRSRRKGSWPTWWSPTAKAG